MTPDELQRLAQETEEADRTRQTLRAQRRQRQLIRDLQREVRDLAAELKLEAARADLALAISDPEPPPPIRPRTTAHREATAVICASDWHIEEVVDPATVNGLNAYGPEISKQRAERFFRGAAWLVNWCDTAGHSQQGYDIYDAILWLGGDLITGQLHEDHWGNPLSPTEAILRVQQYLIAGIDYLVEHTDVARVLVPCSFGNHGRTTPKPRASTGHRYSYEMLLYHSLAQHYAGHPVVSIHPPQGIFTYVELYDRWTLRFTHGDQGLGTYRGGVGGLYVPVRRGLAAANIARKADVTVLGHWHQLLDGGDFVVNGSLIGFNAYALSIRATPEPPRQAFFLMDKVRGKTFFSPIWCADAQG